MIIIAPKAFSAVLADQFLYMADVWLDYDTDEFQSIKIRWQTNNRQYNNSNSMLPTYLDAIEGFHGKQLIVLFSNRYTDKNDPVYIRADIVIQYNTGSSTYTIIKDRFTARSHNNFHSGLFIERVLREYAWG